MRGWQAIKNMPDKSKNSTEHLEKLIGCALDKQIIDFGLSTRTANCLQRLNIYSIRDLVQKSEAELLKTRNLGRKSFREIRELLASMGLYMGMELNEGSFAEVNLNPEKELNSLEIYNNTQDDSTIDVNLARKIVELDFSTRTNKVLAALDVIFVVELIQKQESDLLRLSKFGKKSLKEIKSKLAKIGLSLGVNIPGWTREQALELEKRFSHELQELRIAEARSRAHTQGAAASYLEEELWSLTRSFATERNSEIIVKYLGWDGLGTRTLEEVGHEYDMTRERVRQIKNRFLKKLGGRTVHVPLLDQTIKYVAERCPSAALTVEKGLVRDVLTKTPFKVEGLITAAEATGLSVPFAVQTVRRVRFVSHANTFIPSRRILGISRRAIEHWGCATVEDVIEQVQEAVHSETSDEDMPRILQPSAALVREVLGTQTELRWLDPERTWFWLAGMARNRLTNHVHKILFVAMELHINELRSAISRPHRMAGVAPPRAVLLELCRQLPNITVTGEIVKLDATIIPERILSGTELCLWRILSRNDSIMDREGLETECMKEGMNQSTFYVYLGYSPIITRLARGVYGLVGAKPYPGLIESLTPNRIPGKSLIDHGWTSDANIWIGYELSRPSILTGVLGVPAAVKDFLQGAFELRSIDGAGFGKITVRDTSLWTLTKFFRRRGGEPGDILVMILDPASGTALVRLGDQELLEMYATGEADVEDPSEVQEEAIDEGL